MNIEIGSEGIFFNFIKNLNESDKIALISHVDLDGLVSAKIVEGVIKPDFVKFLNYGEINNNLMEVLKTDGYNKIIFTDLYLKEEQLSELKKFAEVLILDHHPVKANFNSDKIGYIKVEEGYCGAYLCYKLFSKIQNLDRYDWLVASACISDFCNIKNSDWMRRVFEKYDDHFLEGIGFNYDNINESKIHKIQWILSLALINSDQDLKKIFDEIGEEFGDIGDAEKFANEIQGQIDFCLSDFEKNKVEFSGGFYYQLNPNFKISSLLSNIISSRNPDKIILIIREKENCYVFSARRQDAKINMGGFVESIVKGFEGAGGGGHIPAAGGYFAKKDYFDFLERLKHSLKNL